MKTLYIIGNGFDKAHGLPTGYEHFMDWLQRSQFHKAADFAVEMDGLSQNDIRLWYNFEEALGCFDLEKFIDSRNEEYADLDMTDPDNWGKQAAAFYAGIKYFDEDHYNELIEAFRAWAHRIDTSMTNPKYKKFAMNDNYFFTFNYTDTLEQVYHVPQDRILHIHGYAADPQSIIEVGHDHDYCDDRDKVFDILEAKVPADGGDSCDMLIEMLNSSIKPIKEIIKRYSEYFKDLTQKGIEKIVVQGHGYGEIDWPYFKKIKDVCPNAQWELTWYSPQDKKNAQKIDRDLGLNAIIKEV